MRLTWAQKLQAIFSRLNEPYVTAPVPVTGQTNVPYYDQADVEKLLYDVHLQLLREIPVEELEACGSKAVVTNLYTNNGALPLALIDILGSKIQFLAGDAYAPCVELLPAEWFQNVNAQSGTFSVFGGAVHTAGNSIELVLLIEPPLSDFQADFPILPSGYDEEALTLTRQLCIFTDNLPEGQL